MEFKGLTSASHMSLQEAGYGSEEGQLGSEISGAVSGVTTPGASRLQASQSQERSTTMQRLHYHSPDDLSWDEWRLSDSEVERIDLESAASPEEADELEEMTADEMAVDG